MSDPHPQQDGNIQAEKPEKVLRVAIRDLVEFTLQSGDLQSTFVGSGRALAGTRGHQKIQKSRPENYQAEVTISHIHRTSDLTLELRGRIDGVWRQPDGATLEEIKTTTLPLIEISRDNQPLHWGQAKVYAYLYAVQNGFATIGIQLTYLQLDTLEILELVDEFAVADLAPFFQDLVANYLEWATTIGSWQRLRDDAIARLDFPFSNYRKGQRHFAVEVYKAIAEGRTLFAQAPTGIGKTIATVFPALKALGGGKIAKIFYLTAKTVGRGVAEETLAGLSRKGLRCKVLTLTAKEKVCFLEKPDCRPEACHYARGYFDRVKPALKRMFERDRFDREAILEVSATAVICPFEFSLYLSLWADVIIGDYNYAFDPRVFLRRFFDPPADAYAFLIDEAHNLPDRAREMFSADLTNSEFAGLRKQIKNVYPSMVRAIGKITPMFRSWSRKKGSEPEEHAGTLPGVDQGGSNGAEPSSPLLDGPPRELVQALGKFQKLAEAHLVRSEPSPSRDALLEVFFRVAAFLRVAETFDPSFVCYHEPVAVKTPGGAQRRGGSRAIDVRIRLFCLDPADLLRSALKRARSAVFFSATLLPLRYFVEILGGAQTDRAFVLPSPFAPNQLGLLVVPGIRTEFRVRDQSYESIAGIIQTAVSARKGNYLVYFPSYRYLSAVREAFAARFPDQQIIVQETGMPEEAREKFLRTFSADNTETLVGFVVMGGIFGEGIDLRGDRLIGSIIVGVGLPQICLERNLIRTHFQEKSGNGFEVAYRYPGMNRVMQAAGRVIRTEQDRGIVLLIDERFVHSGYRSLFPAEWSHAITVSAGKASGPNPGTVLKRRLDEFWGTQGVEYST